MNVGRCLHVCLQVIGELRRRRSARFSRSVLRAAALINPLGSHPLGSAPQIGPHGIEILGSDPLCSDPLGSEPSPAPILVIWSSAALVLGTWPLWPLRCSSCSFVQPLAAPFLGRVDLRWLRPSHAPVLGLFCFVSACMNAHCLLVCLIVCMLSSTIVCVRACLRACVHECDHPSIVHLCDRVLDFCLAIFRCLFDSSCPHGPTRPHCSRSFPLSGAVLSGVRPTPACGCSGAGRSSALQSFICIIYFIV